MHKRYEGLFHAKAEDGTSHTIARYAASKLPFVVVAGRAMPRDDEVDAFTTIDGAEVFYLGDGRYRLPDGTVVTAESNR